MKERFAEPKKKTHVDNDRIESYRREMTLWGDAVEQGGEGFRVVSMKACGALKTKGDKEQACSK